MRCVIGVDEAGRGALAGPVSVGAVLVPEDFDWKEVFRLVTKKGKRPRLRDSKQLSAAQRDILYEYITQHARLKHASALVDAKTIDNIGIVNACLEAAAIAIAELGTSVDKAEVLLDAGLSVPRRWSQQSFVRGDETIPSISFASIIAKVTRDRYMQDLGRTYTNYRFEQHKGYGTLVHRRMIAKDGLSDVHRTSFCSGLRVPIKSV